MFKYGDRLDNYYLSCLAYNRLEKLFKSGEIDSNLRLFKYQMLYLSHCYFEYLKSKKDGFGFANIVAEYCDSVKFKPVLLAVAEVVSDQLHALKKTSRREAERSREFTLLLKSTFEATLPRNGISRDKGRTKRS
jgi:hypothetical protein